VLDRSAILVTGAAGFIGSHLVEALLAAGETVVAVDDFNGAYAPARKRANLDSVNGHPRFHLVVADIRNRAAITEAVTRWPVRRVVHLAALAGVQPSLRDPVLYADVNVRGTAVVLDVCASMGMEHVVIASSSSVYGSDSRTPFHEDGVTDHPLSPYAATKRANELQCWTYHHVSGRPVTCLRFFTVYGPRNRPDMAVHRFTEAILSDREIVLHGAGTRRDFTFIDDIVNGILAALWRPQGMLVCNLGSAQPVEVRTLVEMLERLLGRSARVRQVDLPPGDVPVTSADRSRAEALLGWRPRTTLADGLEAFVRWRRAQPDHGEGDRAVA
jgi:UDP-glucuronate 4-epimerase